LRPKASLTVNKADFDISGELHGGDLNETSGFLTNH
jgi:hypothetical protein